MNGLLGKLPLGSVLVCSVLLGGGTGSAQEATPDRDALVARLGKELDDTPADVIEAIAAFGDAAALDTLLGVYPKLGSVAQRREVVRALARFDADPTLGAKAMEFVANTSANTRDPEVVDAALDVLDGAERFGKHHLALIVESGAAAELRERALERFAKRATAEDAPRLRRWFDANQNLSGGPAPKSSSGKGAAADGAPHPVPRLRELAFEALAPSLDVRELTAMFEASREPAVRATALRALLAKDAPQTAELAQEVFERVDIPADDRGDAAEVLLAAKGTKVAQNFLQVATAPATPAGLRERLADLLAGLQDEGLDKKLAAMIGRGKTHEKLFALRATRSLPDDQVLDKLRKGLAEKDDVVRRAVVREVARRKDAESVPVLHKMLEKSKDPQDAALALEALAELHAGDAAFTREILAHAASADIALRNAALSVLAARAVPEAFDTFAAALSNEDWATRRYGILGLVALRDVRALPLLLGRLDQERGRLRVELGDALFELTGETFEDQADVWRRWWTDHAKDFAVISKADLEKKREARERARLRQTTSSPAQFFGVRIVSQRVAFVIDTSGSMMEALESETVDGRPATRMEVVKRELLQCLEALPGEALFNLIPFNTAVSPWLEGGLATASKKSRDEAIEFVERLGNKGGTNVHDALEIAFADPEVDTIFVLSDGEPTAGAITDIHAIREAVADWNRNRGVVIHSVSVGAELDLLEWLAEDSGGRSVKFR